MHCETSSRPILLGLRLFPLFCLTASSLLSQTPDTGGVHGAIYTPVLQDRIGLVGNDTGAAAPASAYRLFVPQFKVSLVSTTTDATVATAQTDLFGRYMFRYQPSGTYRVCWNSPGWVAGCAPDRITIRSNIYAVNAASVRPAISSAGGAFWGRVRLSDGSAPYFEEPLFQIKANAALTILDLAGKLLAKTVTNVSGEYVVVNVPSGSVRATAQTEAARASSIASSSAVGTGGAVHLTLPNARPILEAAAAKLAGQGIREAGTGDMLDLVSEARDRDGDTLRYLWKSAPSAGQIISTSNSAARWRLENTVGQQTAYLVVTDDKGGYTARSVTVTAGGSYVAFSGKVTTQNGDPIPKPVIKVNGTSYNGRTDGTFYVKPKRTNRYVVNVHANGYMPASKVFDQGGLFTEYRLVKANVITFDPNKTVQLVARRLDRPSNPIKGYDVRPATITIPAGSLVGPRGEAPVGSLTSYSATIDPSNAEMPGDYGARSSGAETNLISYGALWAEFYDAAGTQFNVAEGKTAEITIAPPPLGRFPGTIALWTYNEATGYWDDARLTASYDATRSAYVGNVKHFSFYNTDIAKSEAACVRILLDNINRNNLKARVSFVAGATPFVQTPEQVLGDSLNAFYRLPANTDVRITVLDAATTAVVATAKLLDVNQQLLTGNVVNTGPANPDLWPATPYEGCVTTSIRLDVPSGSISRIPFLTFYGTGSEDGAIGYYQRLDPGLAWNAGTATFSGGTRSTLGGWWSQAGFNSTTGSGGTRAAYMNHGDLGFGRDMHVRSSGGSVYAYVTNYGKADQNPLNADLAQTADKNVSGATVAMEFSALTGITGNVVKFFVYSNGKPDGKLITSANLDGAGEKFVPNLCTTCHGGAPYFPTAELSPTPLEASLRPSALGLGASFREFDTDALRYPAGAVTLPVASRPTFHALNQLVKASNPQPAITEVIDGWYAGLAAPTTDPPNTAFTPLAWQGSPEKITLYEKVVAKSCRTCHVAFNTTNLNWATYSRFQVHRDTIKNYVCGTPGVAAGTADKFMPHALMTYRNFWLSTGPSQPGTLASFAAPDWSAFGFCQ